MKWYEWVVIGALVLITWFFVFAGSAQHPTVTNVNLEDAQGKSLCAEIDAVGCSASFSGRGSCNNVKLVITPCA